MVARPLHQSMQMRICWERETQSAARIDMVE
jgi:hypothetical protein